MHTATVMRCNDTNTAPSPRRAAKRSSAGNRTDKKSRVTVLVRLEEDKLICDLANGVPLRPNAAESTKIGLQTCRKIIREMGGTFETQMEEGKFLAEIALPIVKEEKA